MTLGLETQHRITDEHDARVFNPVFTSAGDGIRTYETNSDIVNYPLGTTLVLKSPSVASGVKAEAKLTYTYKKADDGTNLPLSGSSYFGTARQHHWVKLKTPTTAIPEGSGVHFVVLSGISSITFNLQAKKSSGQTYFAGWLNGHGSFTSTETVPYDEWFEFRWYWTKSNGSDGVLQADIRRASDNGEWVQAVNINNHTNTSTDARLTTMDLRASLAGTWADATYDIEVAHGEFAVTQDDDFTWVSQGYKDFKGCFVIDATQNKAKIVVNNISPNRFANGSYYRVNYGLDSSLGSTTPWVALNSWDPGNDQYLNNVVELSGLTSKTRYYWRVELAGSASPSSVVVTSNIRSFCTMQSSGDASRKVIHKGSCSGNDGKVRPMTGYKLLSENVTLTSIDYAVHSGDFFYEAGRSEDEDRYAPETPADYLTYYKESIETRYRQLLLESTVFTPFPGDHAFWNNIDGATAATDNVSLIRNDATVGTNYDPASTSTLAVVWANAKDMWDAWYGNHIYNKGDGYYYYRDHGNMRFIQLDGISKRDSSSNMFFGTGQINWLKARCSEVPAGTKILISSDSAWGPINRQSDSVHNIAPDETRGFNEWAETPGNVADGVKITIHEGDTHRGWWFGKAFYDTNGDLIQDPQVLSFNAMFSPMGQAHTVPTVSTDATEIAAFDISGYSAGDLIETSGGVLTFDSSWGQTTARLQAWAANGQTLDEVIQLTQTSTFEAITSFYGDGIGFNSSEATFHPKQHRVIYLGSSYSASNVLFVDDLSNMQKGTMMVVVNESGGSITLRNVSGDVTKLIADGNLCLGLLTNPTSSGGEWIFREYAVNA